MNCIECGNDGPFSNNQRRKGAGRRCMDCVNGGYQEEYFRCGTCGMGFRDQNALEQHQFKHRERSFPCPGCGKMYRGM